jgi:hypothetical protein
MASKIVWSPEKGWHDGQEATVSLDGQGRLTITPTDEGDR